MTGHEAVIICVTSDFESGPINDGRCDCRVMFSFNEYANYQSSRVMIRCNAMSTWLHKVNVTCFSDVNRAKTWLLRGPEKSVGLTV